MKPTLLDVIMLLNVLSFVCLGIVNLWWVCSDPPPFKLPQAIASRSIYGLILWPVLIFLSGSVSLYGGDLFRPLMWIVSIGSLIVVVIFGLLIYAMWKEHKAGRAP